MKLAMAAGACAVVLASCQMAQARITRITITRVDSPAFEGRSFGGVGQYEKLVGHVAGEIDPADPHNAVITDVGLAPRDARGKVAYETDIMILRPIDRSFQGQSQCLVRADQSRLDRGVSSDQRRHVRRQRPEQDC